MSDGVFFIVTKLVWLFISPDSLIVLLGIGAWVCLVIGWHKLSRSLLALCALLLLLVAFLPLGEWLIAPLEQRFVANAALPATADGIIVLGGAISPHQSAAWNQAELGPAADRLTNFLYLARLYPSAQLVFSGGSGSLLDQDLKEAEFTRYWIEQLNPQQRAIIYESESRNTYENIRNSKQLLTPGQGENWILVTSAFHMPRAVAIFCQQQWPVMAYPVDHYSRKGDLLRIQFDFAGNLGTLRTAVREWAGLIGYRISGRTDRFLASDNSSCSSTDN
jgi:uncharacterized SAM-binding protein YcdF (DUF218 family)